MVKFVSMDDSGLLSLNETPVPSLEMGAVLIKTLYSEVCGTDVHLSHQQLASVPYPIIPGHVSTGIVEKINGHVYDINNELIEEGDTITFLDVHETCNSCWYCLVAKETTRCPKRKVYGITYSSDEGLLGGWAQKIYLKPGVKIIKLKSIELAKTFIAAGCGLPTAIHAIQRAKIKLGDSVLIQGSGPVGLMAAILAKLSGTFQLILVGGPKLRLEIAKEFGIDEVINIDEFSVDQRIQQVMNLTNGRGVDKIIEATGVPQAINEGLDMIRDGGTYIIVGQYTDAGSISINPHENINKKHITIKGCWGSDFSHFYLAVKFVEKYDNKFPWEKIISKIYSLEEASQALEDVKNYLVMKSVIKPN
ncbi:MAG: zinc-binding dehydrogenase [Candidatus Heimdallarchaeota archaeon]|nr:zinc-binding dehydrogenase [Candidatus Heimdallarchaeota archaeon]